MIPTIDPKWRTSTVIGLCHGMRETGDYSALPILADALQDADCTSAELLEWMRQRIESFPDDAVLVACVLNDDASESVAWIEHLANEMGGRRRYDDESDGELTWKMLMEYARQSLTEEWHSINMGVNQEAGWTFSGQQEDFWKHYAILTGTATKGSLRFSCSC